MGTFPDLRIGALVADTQRAQELLYLYSSEYLESRDLFTQVRARAGKLGLESAYLAWGIAMASYNLGELDVAFTTISESIAKDPLNPESRGDAAPRRGDTARTFVTRRVDKEGRAGAFARAARRGRGVRSTGGGAPRHARWR